MKKPASLLHEQDLWNRGVSLVAGVDEVGRGAWAGPVVAGAVVFPKNISLGFDVFDSKMLSAKEREVLAAKISEIAKVGIGVIGVSTINRIGIGRAAQKAFRHAIKALEVVPEFLLIDAFYIRSLPKRNQLPIKGGDRVSSSIAAASVVAKVFRDRLMQELDEHYPKYGFSQNKGYGTLFHQKALKDFSLCSVHRKSFDLSAFLA